jgi:histidinol dehydrogenase
MNIVKFPERNKWKALTERPVLSYRELDDIVVPVLQKVKQEGDSALKEFTLKFDKVQLEEIQVSEAEIKAAGDALDNNLKQAINTAYQNIKKFHEAQKEVFLPVETFPGVTCWRKSVGIQRVGLYIPGGTAPLFSTVLMLGTPAKIAGCEELYLCSPPTTGGTIHPAIIYTAALLGVDKIFKTGGAQAIAALAYGTETVPKVDKIFGPGNQFVTVAKQLVNREGTAIDMPAGPSEVAVLADDTGVPEFIAADLLSQAEHGADSQVFFVSDSEEMLHKVLREVQVQLEKLPRKEMAEKSIANSKFIQVKSIAEGIELINEYAPEHLILQVRDFEAVGEKVKNAGSVFLGNYTPEAAGDYASGTNHTLPTNGFARAYSGVSLDSFIRKITYQKITREGLQNLGPVIETMAAAEHLDAHKNAVSVRLKQDVRSQR